VVLTAHVVSSVGWLGAVLAYLALDVTAVTSNDVELVRSAYLTMELIVIAVIVPLALTSVLIGVLNSLGTSWGLFRHYWILVKFLITILATTVLLLQTPTISHLADTAVAADPRGLPGTLAHSIGGLIVLLLATILSVFKPQGLTRYGWRKQQQQRRNQHPQRNVPAGDQPTRSWQEPTAGDRP
jgi:hypothetical protein